MREAAEIRPLRTSPPSWPGLARPSTNFLVPPEGSIVSADATSTDNATGLAPDPSFQRLLGELAWRRLAPAVRERFRWKPAVGAEIRYVGEMAVVQSSAAGWVLAQLCRLIGTPLAPHRGQDVPVTVTLSLDADGAGVAWRRVYWFPGRRAIACVSIKKSPAAEGLIECVGGGIGMWLRLSERGGALHFRSSGYFWALGRWRVALPDWLTPGALHVVHSDEGRGRFRFRISVIHPLLGETFFQDGVFSSEGAEPWSACSCS